MPDTSTSSLQVRPFIYATPTSRSLMFSHSEIQSRMWTKDPWALNLEYTRIMMAFLLFNPTPKHIGMVGLGGGSLAKFCYHHLPAARIDVFEINPHVIALRDAFAVPADDHRFIVLQGDGAKWVQKYDAQMDAILVDGYDINGLPPALTSDSFYDACFNALAPGGIMVCNFHAEHPQYGTYLGRIKSRFEGSVIEVGDTTYAHRIVFACRGNALKHCTRLPDRKPDAMSPEMWRRLAPTFWPVLV